jgi:hypothetical protein
MGMRMKWRTAQFAMPVITNTTVTAIPSPLDDFISLDMEMNEHIPKKFARSMLDVKIDAKNNEKGLITGLIFLPP